MTKGSTPARRMFSPATHPRFNRGKCGGAGVFWALPFGATRSNHSHPKHGSGGTCGSGQQQVLEKGGECVGGGEDPGLQCNIILLM